MGDNKLHEAAIEVGRKLIEKVPELREWVEKKLPELKESEDETIRKKLIRVFKSLNPLEVWNGIKRTDILSWLEKQGEQNNNEDTDILQRLSFYSYKDEPNVLYLSNVFVNEEYRNKGVGTKILEVADEVAKNLNCHAIRLKTKKGSNAERLYRTHGYNSLATEGRDEIWLEKQGEQNPNNNQFTPEQASVLDKHIDKFVEQNSTWSEEDEKMLNHITGLLEGLPNLQNWLKALKERYTWKPSDG